MSSFSRNFFELSCSSRRAKADKKRLIYLYSMGIRSCNSYMRRPERKSAQILCIQNGIRLPTRLHQPSGQAYVYPSRAPVAAVGECVDTCCAAAPRKISNDNSALTSNGVTSYITPTQQRLASRCRRRIRIFSS